MDKTLNFISETVQKYCDSNATINLDEFIFQQMLASFGIQHIAMRYCELWLMSIKTHSNTDDRISLFAKFLGLDTSSSQLTINLFQHYVNLIKNLQLDISKLFVKDNKKCHSRIPFQQVLLQL
jgi:hypothetical protein